MIKPLHHTSKDSLNTLRPLSVNGKTFHYYSLSAAEDNGLRDIHQLPYALKILLENQLRHEDDDAVTLNDIKEFKNWLVHKQSDHEIAYRPGRVLMQDFTGVPAVVDLAALRDITKQMKGDTKTINPLCPVDLIIDHSVQVEVFGNSSACRKNTAIEMDRNNERYLFLKWGSHSLDHLSVVPPGQAICHQANLEYFGKVVVVGDADTGHPIVYPDTLVGTDSHTTMINGIGILGWGVGGIEAEAVMLGQPISMLIPEVVGVCLRGKLREGITATDLVLTITQILRETGVVGKCIEFYGPSLAELAVADRATISNMCPEFGATSALFPIDDETIKYLTLTGRDSHHVALVETYAKAQGLWHDETRAEITMFSDSICLDLNIVEASLAGPKRPQDRIPLSQLEKATEATVTQLKNSEAFDQVFQQNELDFSLRHGDIVIAAITSCTNTSNPRVMLAAGLLAKKAVEKGLTPKPWVKASLAPGSKVVTDYLKEAGLMDGLEKLGFFLVGYGCTTCIGNSGPLEKPIADTITENDLVVSAILSGNRNFEGRIHPLVKANWLASPPLVVAFALAGTTRIDLHQSPIGKNTQGVAIYLKDIWPSHQEIDELLIHVRQSMFQKEYAAIFDGDKQWQQIPVNPSDTYPWDPDSTYIKCPPFFSDLTIEPAALQDIQDARILALLGDSITTDHISPAGAIKFDSPAGKYLSEKNVPIEAFNSYGSRRGNHEVMMRGTFANIRIRNEMLPDVEGGFTKYLPKDEEMAIFDAAMKYQSHGVPLVIMAGKEYGSGSSRDWAAKGPNLLGVKIVIAESFERIHRSNLIGMGILPLEFQAGTNRHTLKITGYETLDFIGLSNLKLGNTITMCIKDEKKIVKKVVLLCRIDTQNELAYYQNGGILQYVLRKMLKR